MNWMVNIESQKMSSHLCFDLTPISGRHSYLFVLCPIFLGDHIKHCDHKIKGSWYSAFGKMWSIRGIVVVVVVAIVVLILLLEIIIIIITTMMIIMKSWDSGLTKLFLCFKQPLDFPSHLSFSHPNGSTIGSSQRWGIPNGSQLSWRFAPKTCVGWRNMGKNPVMAIEKWDDVG